MVADLKLILVEDQLQHLQFYFIAECGLVFGHERVYVQFKRLNAVYGAASELNEKVADQVLEGRPRVLAIVFMVRF